MKAMQFRQHGDASVLEAAEMPEPQPGPGEALVRIRAAALNRMDVAVRKGWPGLRLQLPHINGADGAGEVVAVGGATQSVKVGDHVSINANLGCGHCEYCLAGWDNLCVDWRLLGETVPGTYREYISLPERQLYVLPPGFDFHVAAAAALVFQTAWHSLITKGKLRPGETVLIVGAGGGVNTASLQVAKFAGARVIVIASGAEKAAMALDAGAALAIDRSKDPDWSKAAYIANGKRGVDVVVDNVGTTMMSSLRALRKGGRLLTVGSSGGTTTEIDNRYVFYRHLSVIGSTMSPLRDFRQVMNLVAAGKLKPVIDSTYDLAQAAEAQRRLEQGAHFGKITLRVG
jgi:NADPH:quinone reductase-like Zn-dependent oxidoreductase